MLKFIRKSFRREIVAGFIIVAVIPLIIICTLLVLSFRVIFSEEQKKTANEVQMEINTATTDTFELFNQMVKDIEQDQTIIEFINSTDNWDRKKAYNALYRKTDELKDLVQVDIYNQLGVCKYSTGNNPVEYSLPLNWGILDNTIRNPNKISYLEYKKYLKNNSEESLLLGAKPMMDKGEILGYVVMEIHRQNFDNLFQNIYNSHNVIAVLSTYWDEIYISEAKIKENMIVDLRNKLFNDEKVNEVIKGYIPYILEIPDTGISVLYLQSEILSTNNFNSMYRIIFIFALISLLMSLLVTNSLSNYLIAPVKQLSSAMNETKGGNLDIGIEDNREDEFSILYKDFNEMTLTIKAFTEQRIQNEKELNEANIAMMHAQLNPHFLYNTLDTIKWSGVINHVPQISTMASALAKILRMSISVDKFISLEEELYLVKSYMEIQKIRFENRFNYECHLPDELRKVMVPKLIIQPLVENAVIHGLMETIEGSVVVNCYEEDSVLYIEVIDNGCGIKEEVLNNLNSKGENKLKNHIGFYNINRIISLSYGEEYGLKVERIIEGGTKVLLRLPMAETAIGETVIGEKNV